MTHVRLCTMLLATLLGLYGSTTGVAVGLAQPAAPAAPPEPFPIVSRFEMPRDYGYFIGDEIPLTLVLETHPDVVLDLVNLPRPGARHGLFEIRHFDLTTTTRPDATRVYRIAYTLQYFGPTPLSMPFGPLEILYALPERVSGSTPRYTYQHLMTQPAILHLARLGPQQAVQGAIPKGTWDDPRTGTVWGLWALGTVCVLLATAGWTRLWYTGWQQRRSAVRPLTATEAALQRLHQEGADVLRPLPVPTTPVGSRLNDIIRAYLQAAHQVPAFTLTTAELAGALNGAPHAQDLLQVLTQCEALKYQQPAAVPPAAERALWGQTVAVFEALHEDGTA